MLTTTGTAPGQPATHLARPSDILAVWTREITPEFQNFGQMKILVALRRALLGHGEVAEVTLRSPLEEKSAGAVLAFAGRLLRSALAGRPLPLQCALFGVDRTLTATLRNASPAIAVFDGIRSLDAIAHLRKARPDLPIIVAMDDLLSRRTDLLLQGGHEVSLGAFASRLPGVFSRALRSRLLSRTLLRYERMALRRAEEELLRLADTVVMVSGLEICLLASRPRAAPPRARLVQALPPAEIPARCTPFGSNPDPIRYAFVGSDRLVQNRSSIDHILGLWGRGRPAADLVIFGRQHRPYDRPPPRVRIAGEFGSASEVYDGRTVLLTPTFLAGGIKTKVFEAFAYQAPVIGTALTYEGLDTHEAFLTLDGLGLDTVLSHPESLRPRLIAAAQAGSRLVAQEMSVERYVQRWELILAETGLAETGPATPTSAAPPAPAAGA